MKPFGLARQPPARLSRWMVALTVACLASVAAGAIAWHGELPEGQFPAMSAEARLASQQLTAEFRDQARRKGVGETMFGAQREGDALAEAAKLSTVVVAIMQETAPGQMQLKSAGTGFVAANSGVAGSPNRVVSVNHVVETQGDDRLRVVIFDSRGRMMGEARRVSVPGEADVAAVAIEQFLPDREAEWRSIPGLALAPPAADQTLSAVPFGTTPAPMQGSSGSPLLDGVTGAVVGVLFRRIPLCVADEEFEVGDVVASLNQSSTELRTGRHAMTSAASGIVQTIPPAVLQALGQAGRQALGQAPGTAGGPAGQAMRSGLLIGFPDMAAVITPVYYQPVAPTLLQRAGVGGG